MYVLNKKVHAYSPLNLKKNNFHKLNKYVRLKDATQTKFIRKHQ